MSCWVPGLQAPDYIKGNCYRFNVRIITWDRWSWWHLIGTMWLGLLSYHLPILRWEWFYDLCGHPALYAYGLAILWEVLDGAKPLWCEWPYLKPKWIPEGLWNKCGHVLNSDGFSLHDALLPDLIGAVLCWLLVWQFELTGMWISYALVTAGFLIFTKDKHDD